MEKSIKILTQSDTAFLKKITLDAVKEEKRMGEDSFTIYYFWENGQYKSELMNINSEEYNPDVSPDLRKRFWEQAKGLEVLLIASIHKFRYIVKKTNPNDNPEYLEALKNMFAKGETSSQNAYYIVFETFLTTESVIVNEGGGYVPDIVSKCFKVTNQSKFRFIEKIVSSLN